jgi:hypothetical protein
MQNRFQWCSTPRRRVQQGSLRVVASASCALQLQFLCLLLGGSAGFCDQSSRPTSVLVSLTASTTDVQALTTMDTCQTHARQLPLHVHVKMAFAQLVLLAMILTHKVLRSGAQFVVVLFHMPASHTSAHGRPRTKELAAQPWGNPPLATIANKRTGWETIL